MSDTVEAFHEEFFNEVRAHADAGGRFMETTFLEDYGEWLVNAGELDTFDVAQYATRTSNGAVLDRVDGYGGDPIESEGVLSLAIVDFSPDPVMASLTGSDVTSAFKKLDQFLRKAFESNFREQLEESSPGYGLAELISTHAATLFKLGFTFNPSNKRNQNHNKKRQYKYQHLKYLRKHLQ